MAPQTPTGKAPPASGGEPPKRFAGKIRTEKLALSKDELPANFKRADLVVSDVEHGGHSFEARIFLNNTAATAETPLTAEHGRGLKIIDAVVDNLQLTRNEREGTIVRFEKTLEWLPGAAGQHLFRPDGGSQGQPGQAAGGNQ